jgi:hypothetical protein
MNIEVHERGSLTTAQKARVGRRQLALSLRCAETTARASRPVPPDQPRQQPWSSSSRKKQIPLLALCINYSVKQGSAVLVHPVR